MEEFWKDIFVASFHDQDSHYFSTATHCASRTIILHDFLAKPFAGDNPSPDSVPPPKATSSSFLSLSSGSDFQPSGSYRSSSSRLLKGADDSFTDQKRERLIKNRESAARSRAKKHAYINELELEVARLRKENAELRRQQQKSQMYFEGNTHLPTKRLQRTLTAPF